MHVSSDQVRWLKNESWPKLQQTGPHMVDNDKIISEYFADDNQKRLLLVREQYGAGRVARNTYSHQDEYNSGWYGQANAFSKRS